MEQLNAQTIVVCDERAGDVSGVSTRFPEVEIIQIPGNQTEDQLLAVGIRHARGEVIAVTHDHCTPEKNWCARILKEHEGPYAAVGGANEKGSQPDTALNWAVHFYDESAYGSYLNPVIRGPVKNLSICNVSYKTSVLNRLTEKWVTGFNVPTMNRVLIQRGEILWLSPELVVYQQRDLDINEALREPFNRGRSFACDRIAGLTFRKRMIYIVFSPFLPLILLTRLVMNVHHKQSYFRILVRAFPLTALLATIWSWGEFIGYLTARANSKHSLTEG